VSYSKIDLTLSRMGEGKIVTNPPISAPPQCSSLNPITNPNLFYILSHVLYNIMHTILC
jgi:hypothetical protein